MKYIYSDNAIDCLHGGDHRFIPVDHPMVNKLTVMQCVDCNRIRLPTEAEQVKIDAEIAALSGEYPEGEE